jgi:putative ubiquitin-RnfH superfamily antitoxin RatB of RatAB toxin-antitoxin module
MAPAETALLHVQVAFSAAPGQCALLALQLPPGSTLADAWRASGFPQEDLKAGIWGKAKTPDTVLRDHDRVELYRPLTVDPKEARRQRYQRDKPARTRKLKVQPAEPANTAGDSAA